VAVVVAVREGHQNVTTARKLGTWHVNALRAILEVATTNLIGSQVMLLH